MNVTETPISPYLKRLVDDNYLLTQEARILNRLPVELQEKALQLAESQRIPLMEQIVSGLLDPSSQKPAGVQGRIRQAWEFFREIRWWKWAVAGIVLSFFWTPIGPRKARGKITKIQPPVVMPKGLVRPDPPLSAPGAGVPVPERLIWHRLGPGEVRLKPGDYYGWYRYNVYASYAGDPDSWALNNDQPLNASEITWTAPTRGNQVFELYVTAVDAEGRESAPTNHITADLR